MYEFSSYCNTVHKFKVSQQQSKRLNSANKQRRRLLQRESRSPELVRPDLTPTHQPEVFQTLNLRNPPPQERIHHDDDDVEEDGDVTPKVCQLDSVRELDEDREIREITERHQQSNCWSSFSWSSLYDRGTDSSLSWADDVRILSVTSNMMTISLFQEYEKETTETVRKMFADIEELFYEPSSSHSQSRHRRKSSQSQQTPQEKECQMWRDNFPNLRYLLG